MQPRGPYQRPPAAGGSNAPISSNAFCPIGSGHLNPSLYLDKWHELKTEGDKEFDKRELRRVAELSAPKSWDARLLERSQKQMRSAVGSFAHHCEFQVQTTTPMALHLARSTGFENACFALHRTYGFPYIPASGIKGLTRAYAVKLGVAAELIDRVFGKADREDGGGEFSSCAGEVVFFDALPAGPCGLVLDIVNNHHSKYYSEGKPPEDWEDPIPVHFLALQRGAKFGFSLALRHGCAERAILDQAGEWLRGALWFLGAGAKTNAGYGRFAAPAASEAKVPAGYETFTCDIRFETPAFLAGAAQTKEDCELRAASLRGELRWWWRALFLGVRPLAALRELESSLWGGAAQDGQDGSQEGAIAVIVEPLSGSGGAEPREFRPERSTPEDPNRAYLAYGMERSRGKEARFVLPEGTTWRVTLRARAGGGREAGQVLNFAKAALMFLSSYGGIGAKSRKGFGSISILGGKPIVDMATVSELSKSIATLQKLDRVAPSMRFQKSAMYEIKASNGSDALDLLAKAYKSIPAKGANYGLPRKGAIHPAGKYSRHASPVHFKLWRAAEGRFRLRATVIPSPHLNRAQTRPEDGFGGLFAALGEYFAEVK